MPQSDHRFPRYLPVYLLAVLLLLEGCVSGRNIAHQPEPQAVDVLMLAYDNGDGRAFQALTSDLNARGISWHIISFGPAASLYPDDPRITNLNREVSSAQAREWFDNRYAEIPPLLSERLLQQFQPQIVLTGMAHAAQALLLRQWWNKGAWTLAFYDNMEPPGQQPWVTPWLEQTPPVEQLLVPDSHLAKGFPAFLSNYHPPVTVYHPGLEEWKSVFEREDGKALKHTLGLDGRPVALIIGGYGDGYRDSLSMIGSAIPLRPDLQWLITPHPRTNGTLEQALADSLPQGSLQVVRDMATVRVASIANLVLSHRSSAGWQAASMGVPVVFVRPEARAETLNQGAVRIVTGEPALLNAIYRQLDSPATQSFPTRSTATPEKLVDILERRLTTTQ